MIQMPRYLDFLEAIFTTMIIAALYASFVVLRQSVEDMQRNSCGEALWKTLSVITGLKMLNFSMVFPIHQNKRISTLEITFFINYVLLNGVEYYQKNLIQEQAHTDQQCADSLTEMYNTRHLQLAMTLMFSVFYDVATPFILIWLCIHYASATSQVSLFPSARNTYGTFGDSV
jgi:hypothetical protein